MAFIPALNTAKVALEYTVLAQPVVNTLYFQHTLGAINQTQLEDLTGAVQAWWDVYMQPLICSAGTLDNIVATDLTSQQSIQDTRAVGLQGGDVTAALPNNIALCVKFTTGFTGRSARGRNYVCSTPESQVTGNLYAQSYSDDMVAAYAALLPGGLANIPNWEWVIASFVSNKLPRSTAQLLPVSGVSVTNRRVDTMRRRLGKE